jgi:N6-L-threonylcarbamoyladenine synthase
MSLILGIETSCDETGIALIQGDKLIANFTATSLQKHVEFGGVIPEIASREHLTALPLVYKKVLAQAADFLGVTDDEVQNSISAVTVTAYPGLIGCLSTGISFAKGLVTGLRFANPGAEIAYYGVNHILGHIGVNALEYGTEIFDERVMGLAVSGGHTSLYLIDDIADLGCEEGSDGGTGEGTAADSSSGTKTAKSANPTVTEIGHTLDDAVGECFDKVGRMIGIPYPAGPEIDKLAASFDPEKIDKNLFPRALTKDNAGAKYPLDFSYSGLKTSVKNYIAANPDVKKPENLPELCANFSYAATRVIVDKTMKACKLHNVKSLAVGGGFSANSMLRSGLVEACDKNNIKLYVPPLEYCTDNGAMIACLGNLIAKK